jgi:hypothetical protein
MQPCPTTTAPALFVFVLLGLYLGFLLGHKMGWEKAEDKCTMLVALWAPQALEEHASFLGMKRTKVAEGLYLYNLPDGFHLFEALDESKVLTWAHEDELGGSDALHYTNAAGISAEAKAAAKQYMQAQQAQQQRQPQTA